MPVSLPCKFCERVGFVRFETVLTHGKSYKHYYCGVCNRTWQIDEADPQAPADPPDSIRKRPLKRSE